MQNADYSKVSELEHPIHDPHQVRQDTRPGVPGRHQHGHVGRTLVVGKHEGTSVSAGGWLITGLHDWKEINIISRCFNIRFFRSFRVWRFVLSGYPARDTA